MVTGRGAHEEIDVVPGFPLNNKLSGNVVDLCPVGALGDKDFLYQQRVWFLRRHRGRLHRLRDRLLDLDRGEPGPHLPHQAARESARQPVVDLQRGRYDYPHVHDPRRLIAARAPRRRRVACDARLDRLAGRVARAACATAGRLAAVLSPHSDGRRGVSAVPVHPRHRSARPCWPWARAGGGRGRAVSQRASRSRAEKCPNRRGVEAVIAHFARRVMHVRRVPAASWTAARSRGVWVSGGYKNDWIDEATAARFERLELLVVQDLFPSPLSRAGDVRAARRGLSPSATARTSTAPTGCNRSPGRSARRRACGPRAACFGSCLGRKGLYNAAGRAGRDRPRDPLFLRRRRRRCPRRASI